MTVDGRIVSGVSVSRSPVLRKFAQLGLLIVLSVVVANPLGAVCQSARRTVVLADHGWGPVGVSR